MRYRFTIFTFVCLNLSVRPILADENDGLLTRLGTGIKTGIKNGWNGTNPELENAQRAIEDAKLEAQRYKEEAQKAIEAAKLEAQRTTEETQKDLEAAKLEAQRYKEEARKAEEATKVREAERVAEEERKAEEAAKVREAERVAEEERKAIEATKIREAERAAEEARKAEEAAKVREAERAAEEARKTISNKKKNKGSLESKDDGCSFISAHAIADYLNSINIESLFDYASKHILRNNECFVLFDSNMNLAVWVEPYGFNAHYRSKTKSKDVDLTLSSIGAGMGARYVLFDHFHLGGGAGYFRSNFDCKGDKAHINGVFFGPSIKYLFADGSIGFMIMAVSNSYEGEIKRSKECDNISYDTQSWDIDYRLEAEYDVHLPADFFIKDLTVHPYFRFDYLNVFESGFHKDKVHVKDHLSNWIYSKLAARLEKMVFCNQTGFLTANFDLGWVNMTPLSSNVVEWRSIDGKGESSGLTTQSKNQCALGFELVGMYHKLLLGLGYQAAIGSNSPMQTGRARIEWNW